MMRPELFAMVPSFSRTAGRRSPYSRPVYLSDPALIAVNAPCQMERSSLIDAWECPVIAMALGKDESAVVMRPSSRPQCHGPRHVFFGGACWR